MSFQYQPMDNDCIEDMGNIQSEPGDSEQILCPARPLLPHWPYHLGLLQIAAGFLTLIFGVVEVSLVPFLISVDGQWSLTVYNSYGAGVWTGILLILAGSLAVRASKTKALLSIQQWYWMTLLAFVSNMSLLMLMLWCARHWNDVSLSHYMQADSDVSSIIKGVSDVSHVHDVLVKLQTYTWVSMVTSVWCMMGCFLLLLSVCNYFMLCMFGDVRLLKSLGICCCPCIFYRNPPSHGSSIQSMSGSESNMVI